jgi:hypothetical protein
MAKTKATLREEQELAEQIGKAHSFSAFLLFGPRDRRKVMIDEGGPEGYRKARLAADHLNDQARADGSTRSAIVYAINSLGSFDVTPEAAQRAGLI